MLSFVFVPYLSMHWSSFIYIGLFCGLLVTLFHSLSFTRNLRGRREATSMKENREIEAKQEQELPRSHIVNFDPKASGVY